VASGAVLPRRCGTARRRPINTILHLHLANPVIKPMTRAERAEQELLVAISTSRAAPHSNAESAIRSLAFRKSGYVW